VPPCGDVELLACDLAEELATVDGTLSAIGIRLRLGEVSADGPPAGRPLLQHQNAVRQMEADVSALTGASANDRAGLALSVAGRFNLLQADISSVRSMAQLAGIPEARDAELWMSADEALRRAGIRLLSLVLAVSPVTGWSVNRAPSSAAAKPWILIELG
jgi:hypothetical protein